MRLNALSPSENPIEEMLFCFGGPDDSGGSGGSGSTTDDAYDNQQTGQGFDPGFDDGDTGDTGGFDPGFDEGDTGDTGGFDAGFDDGDTGDTGGFGGPPDGGAGAAGSNIDDLIEQSSAFGYGPNIQSTDLPSQAEVSAAIAAGIPGIQAQTTGFTAPSVAAGQIGRAPGDMSRDTSIERDIFGSGEEDYTTQDIFEPDPTGLGFETPEERNQRERRENALQTARDEAARQATAEAQRQAQMAALGVSPQDRALQAELDAINQAQQTRQAEEDALSAQLDAVADENRAAREARTTDLDTLMGGTVFGAPDVTGQAKDIGMGQSAAVPGITGGVRGVTEIDATKEAADAALAATTGGIQNITDAQGNVIGVERGVNLGGGITQAELDQARAEGRAKQGLPSDSADGTTQAERAAAAAAVAAEERTVNGVPVTDFSQPRTERPSTFNPTVEVTDLTTPQNIFEEQPEDEAIYGSREVVSPPAATLTDEERASQQGVDAGPPDYRDFDGGDIGDFYEFLAPEVQKKADEEAKATREAVEQGRTLPGEVNIFEPGSIVRDVIRNFTMRDEEFARQVNLPGNRLQTNAQGQITGVYNPRENAVYTPESVGFFDFKGREAAAGDLYDMQREKAEQERARNDGGDGGTPIIPPLIEEEPIILPEEEAGMDMGAYQYEPMAPVQYAYTGLPTLAPFTLRPSRQVSSDFRRPLYGLGSLRRS